MWADNETDHDFVNFGGVAESVAELIVRAKGRPISIGVSGEWGTGKSSMIKLVERALRHRNAQDNAFVFVTFNAWLYQGYDDARAALLDVIADTLLLEAEQRRTAKDKVIEFAKRVRWLRVAKWLVGGAVAMKTGVLPFGLGRVWDAVSGKAPSPESVASGIDKAQEVAADLLAPEGDRSPPKEIQALRDSLEASLKELGITLVVLIDDLDRCLPETTISTLEAIRLFLFLERTAFVIAADTMMIKHAVRKHFKGFKEADEERMVTNYFDKLIQVPIRVPPLGTQEVRAYLHQLFIENSNLSQDLKKTISASIANQLQHCWQGKRVDVAFLQREGGAAIYPALLSQLATADRLAPMMVSSLNIAGNPRLIKRFLNAVSIRTATAKAQGIDIDEAVLVKLLLFERMAPASAYGDLLQAVNQDAKGRPTILAEMEALVQRDDVEPDFPAPWDGAFVMDWIRLAPPLAGVDLRGALYVGREHAPLITVEDRLSSDAVQVLNALLATPDLASSLKDKIVALPRPELLLILNRLLGAARTETEWGAPPILEACLAVVRDDPGMQNTLAAFLIERPVNQLRPNVVPKIGDYAWSESVFEAWLKQKPDASVKNAITTTRKRHGNISK